MWVLEGTPNKGNCLTNLWGRRSVSGARRARLASYGIFLRLDCFRAAGDVQLATAELSVKD